MVANRMISPDEVAAIFDDTRIAALAKTAGLPKDANMRAFADEIRRAAVLYLSDARRANTNDLRYEIERLYKAARQRRFDHTARLINILSPAARDYLSAANPKTKIPAVGVFLDGAKWREACEQVEQLCSFGGKWMEGRRRPNGKTSRTWRPLLFAPPASPHFAKRDAERNFVLNIRLAYLESCGVSPAPTARLVRKGPGVHMISGGFGRMVDDCLRLVGAPHVRTVGIINELARRRRSVQG